MIVEGKFYCEICYDDHPEKDKHLIPGCAHTFCIESLKEYFTYQITQSGKGYILKCPQQGCGRVLLDAFLQPIVD